MLIAVIINEFVSFSAHELQEYLVLVEKWPFPRKLWMSHSSHNAPICPIKHEVSPSFHPPKQLLSKLIH